MTEEQLSLANKIKAEIKELEDFLWYAERAWQGKMIKRESKFLFGLVPYGMIEENEIELDTDMKNKMLNVLRERLDILKEELHKL